MARKRKKEVIEEAPPGGWRNPGHNNQDKEPVAYAHGPDGKDGWVWKSYPPKPKKVKKT